MNNISPHSLGASVAVLHGVGARVEEKLNRLGIYKVHDLLFHLPLRYIDRTRIIPIGSLQAGKSALVEGTVEITQIRFGRRRSLLCRISDGTGALTLRFFHFSKSQQDRLQRYTRIRCYGQARHGTQTLEMIHPEYQSIATDQLLPVDEHLTPIYPTTDGLQQNRLRKLTAQALTALEQHNNDLSELLPDKILKKFNLPELSTAIVYVHRPPPDAATQNLMDGIHPAQQRLAFEELLAQYLSLRRLRQHMRSHEASALTRYGSLTPAFLRQLPFTLTTAQQRAIDEIRKDLKIGTPMLRLLQGDVGSGKTVVAALSALQTIESGYQVAIMAPTELLAEQHYSTFHGWLKALAVPIILITGKTNKTERNRGLSLLASQTPCIAIGTHALFQQGVEFAQLRLIIIDEQHRFGVHQRLALLDKGQNKYIFPHQLIMTATPIPRTLAMTVYADLDISIIDELPPGRQPVNTVVIPTSKRDDVITRIKQACDVGRLV